MRDRLEEFMKSGVQEGVFPGVVLLVAQGGETAFFEATGFRCLVPTKEPMKRDTIFDLASLTKPLATTLSVMKLVDAGKIALDRPLGELLDKPVPKDKRDIALRLLLCHSGGFADWKPFYGDLAGHPVEDRKRLLREWLMAGPLAYPPGEDELYSDLGFMILEWMTEERAGEPLSRLLEDTFYGPLGLEKTFLGPQNRPKGITDDLFAATEDCPRRRRVIRGEVHDDNAYALGGYSGHAGLFGTAEEVYLLVNMLREHYLGMREDFLKPDTVRAFFKRQGLVKGSTWALGWDTPSPENSSAGAYFSRRSVGHLGFTGTSVWMDLEKDVIVILLTNRIHPTRENETIRRFRPRIHDMVMEFLKLS